MTYKQITFFIYFFLNFFRAWKSFFEHFLNGFQKCFSKKFQFSRARPPPKPPDRPKRENWIFSSPPRHFLSFFYFFYIFLNRNRPEPEKLGTEICQTKPNRKPEAESNIIYLKNNIQQRNGTNEHLLRPTTMGIGQNFLKFHFLYEYSLKSRFQEYKILRNTRIQNFDIFSFSHVWPHLMDQNQKLKIA